MAKRFNRATAVALSVALLSTSAVGFVPQALAEGSVPDADSWKYAVIEDFEPYDLTGDQGAVQAKNVAGTSYDNWDSYCENVTDVLTPEVGAGNSQGMHVFSTDEKTGGSYCQPFYYHGYRATENYAGASELWLWLDFSQYTEPGGIRIRPKFIVGGSDVDAKMKGGAPVYFQTADGFRASTLTDVPEDGDINSYEATLRAEDLDGFKGYVRIPLTSFQAGSDLTAAAITGCKGAYWIFDFSFTVDDLEEYVENGYVVDNILLAGASMTGGTVASLLGKDASDEDQEAADAVIALIAGLPADLTLDDKADVEGARTAYNALSAGAKALVTNYSVLTAAEATIQRLENEAAITDEMRAAAKAARDAIAALPAADQLTLNDKAAVEAARAAYEAVPETARDLVDNLRVLTKAEARIETLIAEAAAAEADKAAAKAVTDKIAALPEKIRPADEAAVKAARTAYDALTETQQALVSNLSTLEKAEKQLAVFTNRTPEDPDPSWSYLPAADFENLKTGYEFDSEKDPKSPNAYMYMFDPADKKHEVFHSYVAANGFNGSKAFNFGGLSDKGSYCQPLLRLDQLGGETLKDFRGAEEMVLYVDFTHIKMDNIGMQFRFMENDGVTDEGTATGISEYGLKDGAFVYIQNSAGKWIKVYNNQSAFSDAAKKLPQEVTGRIKQEAGDEFPNGLSEMAGYKGMIRIPLSQFENINGQDSNGKMDLRQVTQLWLVFNFPGDQKDSYFVLDQIGFVGNFSTSGQGEISVLDVLEMSGSRDAEKDDDKPNGGADTGDAALPACAGAALLAAASGAVCIRSRKRRK